MWISATQFALLRIVFGVYFAAYFVFLLWKNPISLVNNGYEICTFALMCLCAVFSILFILGKGRRYCASFILLGWLISNTDHFILTFDHLDIDDILGSANFVLITLILGVFCTTKDGERLGFLLNNKQHEKEYDITWKVPDIICNGMLFLTSIFDIIKYFNMLEQTIQNSNSFTETKFTIYFVLFGLVYLSMMKFSLMRKMHWIGVIVATLYFAVMDINIDIDTDNINVYMWIILIHLFTFDWQWFEFTRKCVAIYDRYTLINIAKKLGMSTGKVFWEFGRCETENYDGSVTVKTRDMFGNQVEILIKRRKSLV